MSELTAFERFKIKIGARVEAAQARCWFLHAWSPWRITERFTIVRSVDQGRVGEGLTQERRCARCGKSQMHTTRSVLK